MDLDGPDGSHVRSRTRGVCRRADRSLEPSVIATPNGALLAFAEGRRAGAGDAGDIDLVLKRSVDMGASWSELQVIGDDGHNTFGNPCPVVDSTTGEICLLTTHNLGSDREQDIVAGTSREGRTVWVMKSGDVNRSTTCRIRYLISTGYAGTA